MGARAVRPAATGPQRVYSAAITRNCAPCGSACHACAVQSAAGKVISRDIARYVWRALQRHAAPALANLCHATALDKGSAIRQAKDDIETQPRTRAKFQQLCPRPLNNGAGRRAARSACTSGNKQGRQNCGRDDTVHDVDPLICRDPMPAAGIRDVPQNSRIGKNRHLLQPRQHRNASFNGVPDHAQN